MKVDGQMGEYVFHDRGPTLRRSTHTGGFMHENRIWNGVVLLKAILCRHGGHKKDSAISGGRCWQRLLHLVLPLSVYTRHFVLPGYVDIWLDGEKRSYLQ